MYGITETTVHVTYRLIGYADVFSGCGSLIGGPEQTFQIPGSQLISGWGWHDESAVAGPGRPRIPLEIDPTVRHVVGIIDKENTWFS